MAGYHYKDLNIKPETEITGDSLATVGNNSDALAYKATITSLLSGTQVPKTSAFKVRKDANQFVQEVLTSVTFTIGEFDLNSEVVDSKFYPAKDGIYVLGAALTMENYYLIEGDYANVRGEVRDLNGDSKLITTYIMAQDIASYGRHTLQCKCMIYCQYGHGYEIRASGITSIGQDFEVEGGSFFYGMRIS